MLYVGPPFYSATKSTLKAPNYFCRRSHQKEGSLDPLDDDDDIEWKANQFNADSLDGSTETPEELMSKTVVEIL